MGEVEKREYETKSIVWMLIWRELVWQIPFTMLIVPMMLSVIVLPKILAYVVVLLFSILILVFTTKLAFKGTTKKAIIRAEQVKQISAGYLLSFVVTGINNMKTLNIVTIISMLIQLVVVYLYIKKLLTKVAI